MQKPDIEQVPLPVSHHTRLRTSTTWLQLLHCAALKCQRRHTNGEHPLMGSDAPGWLAGAPEGARAAGERRAATWRQGQAAQAGGARQRAGVPVPHHPETSGVSVVSLCVRC